MTIYRHVFEDGVAILDIPNVGETFEVSCVATSEAGSAATTAKVTVIEEDDRSTGTEIAVPVSDGGSVHCDLVFRHRPLVLQWKLRSTKWSRSMGARS